ncbi:MAG: CPBP family intramembrane metalloprotease [Chitinophagaceae bacterium]|nr:MAG: CPBP family intramembrane metalloprotease [Chitinophagaceae bacterium]
MNNIAPRTENNPWLQILLLLGYAILGALVFSVIAMAIIIPLYGFDVILNLGAGNIEGANLNALRILQLFSSIGMFALPPVLLAKTEKIKTGIFYGFKAPNAILIIGVILLMVVSMPFMEWVVALNQKMTFPESFAKLEQWMRRMEDEAMRQTYAFLKISNGWDLPVNLFIIAIVPAIGEELMFRGALQRTFSRLFSNHHFVIWITAFLFSAIHMQFFGFFPRMFLGAAFGYLYVWTGSLWYPIIAHFLNNAYAVIVAWYLQKQNIPLDSVDKTMEMHWSGYIVSGLLTLIVFLWIKRTAEKNNGKLD